MHRTLSLIALVVVAALSAACGDAGVTTTAPAPSATTVPAVTSSTAPPSSSTSAVSTPASSTTTRPAPTTATSTTTTTIADDTVEIVITVTGGEVDGPGRAEVDGGSDVRLIVTTDTSDELHVHGYDRFADTTPGQPVTLEFVADIPGIFEVELEDAHLEILELVVGA